MDFPSLFLGFLFGCAAWEYFGKKIKLWLHLDEALAVARIKLDVEKLKGKKEK